MEVLAGDDGEVGDDGLGVEGELPERRPVLRHQLVHLSLLLRRGRRGRRSAAPIGCAAAVRGGGSGVPRGREEALLLGRARGVRRRGSARRGRGGLHGGAHGGADTGRRGGDEAWGRARVWGAWTGRARVWAAEGQGGGMGERLPPLPLPPPPWGGGGVEDRVRSGGVSSEVDGFGGGFWV